MKKYIKYLVISFLMFFCFNSGVKAEQLRYCKYSSETGSTNIAFAVDKNGNFKQDYSWDIEVKYVGFDMKNIYDSQCPNIVYIGRIDDTLLVYANEKQCKEAYDYSLTCDTYSQTNKNDEIIDDSKVEDFEDGNTESPGGDIEGVGPGGCAGKDCMPPGKTPTIFDGNCPTNLGIIDLLNSLYTLLKIVTPIALVIFGMIDFGKAVASSDEGKMKHAQSAFIRRLLAAVTVFLVMALVSLLSNLIPTESGVFSCLRDILK